MSSTPTEKDYSKSIAVVYPCSWPEGQDESHCTILYLGEKDEVDFTEQDVQEVLDRAGLVAPGTIKTDGLEWFGENKDVSVVRLVNSPILEAQKIIFEVLLLGVGIKNASSFPDYKPHITVSDPEISIPGEVELGAPELWW